MKKAIIILTTLLLLTTITKANTLYTDQTEYEYDKDDIFTVTLYVNLTNVSYGLFLYELIWNQEIIELQSVKNPTEWEMKYSVQGGIEPGKIKYVNWWKMGHSEIGTLPILELTYKAIKKGNTELQFLKATGLYSHTFDEEANIYELECTNATVIINDDSSTNGNGGNGNGGNGGYTPPPPINKHPVANIIMPTEQYVNTTVNFTANQSYDEDGMIVDYRWNFGDDQTTGGMKVSHIYNQPNVYTVSLTVEDDDGVTDTITKTIIILKQAEPEPDNNETEEPDPTDNQTDDSITEPDDKDTNITKETDDFGPIIIGIFIVAILVCIMFVYVYKRRN